MVRQLGILRVYCYTYNLDPQNYGIPTYSRDGPPLQPPWIEQFLNILTSTKVAPVTKILCRNNISHILIRNIIAVVLRD